MPAPLPDEVVLPCHDTSMELALVELIDPLPFHLVISPDLRIAQSVAPSRDSARSYSRGRSWQHFRLLRPPRVGPGSCSRPTTS